MSDRYIGKELVLYDCDLQLDTGERATYSELWIRPLRCIEDTHNRAITGFESPVPT